MKIIKTHAVREEADIVCDITGQPAVAKLIMSFGYGSVRDMDLLEIDLSNEAAEEVLKLLQSKYPQMLPKESEDFTSCPLCKRR